MIWNWPARSDGWHVKIKFSLNSSTQMGKIKRHTYILCWTCISENKTSERMNCTPKVRHWTFGGISEHLRQELPSQMQRAWFASRCIIGFFSFPFYLPSVSLSRLSSPAILVGEIFPCKGTASVRSSSTAALTGPRIKRQPSANQRFGYSVKFPAYLLAFAVLFPLLDPHVKSIPKGSRKGFDKREK